MPAPPSRPRQRKAASEYVEDPDWGTAFQREDNTPPQPGFTGSGVLSAETIAGITAAGGAFQIAVFVRNRDGELMRTKNGILRFRVHIEPPWEGDETAAPNGRADEDEPLPF